MRLLQCECGGRPVQAIECLALWIKCSHCSYCTQRYRVSGYAPEEERAEWNQWQRARRPGLWRRLLEWLEGA